MSYPSDHDSYVQNRTDANIDAGSGVAIREFSLGYGYGEADKLSFVDGVAVGVIEAKKEGSTLAGVEESRPGNTVMGSLKQLLFGVEVNLHIETRATVGNLHRDGSVSGGFSRFMPSRNHAC